ncbi:MAG: hypothetical protein JEZ12_26375 [Desulfobacterium sp.]|nr:hypothetical protein [Desulfobacterium sp.]
MCMRAKFLVLAACAAILVSIPFSAPGLEALSNRQLSRITAQSGLNLEAAQGLFYLSAVGVGFSDVGTVDPWGTPLGVDGYLHGDLGGIFTLDTEFALDIGNFLEPDPILVQDDAGGSIPVLRSLDHPLNHRPMLFLSQTEGGIQGDFRIADLTIWDHGAGAEEVLGDLSVSGLALSSTRLALFAPPGGTGIRILAGGVVVAETIRFSTLSPENDLLVSGLMLGSSFSGTPLPEDNLGNSPIDTRSWALENGSFNLGNPCYYNDILGVPDLEPTALPLSVDVAGDREVGPATCLVINAPMEGSLRIKSVSANGFDLGPMAIDGLRLYKNVIEFPGRGIGH